MDVKRLEMLFMSRLYRANPLANLQEALQNNHKEVLDINREQLEQGEDSSGKDMGFYSPMYAEYKGKSSPIDLKNTGDYHEAMYLVIDKVGTDVRDRDYKDQRLKAYVKKKTGGDPLGINPKNKGKMSDVVRPEFTKLFRKDVL